MSYIDAARRNEIIDRIEKYPSITLTPQQWADIATIVGADYPLDRFIGAAEFFSIIEHGRLLDGSILTRPMLLLVDEENAEKLDIDLEILLRDRNGKNLAILHLKEKFAIDKDDEKIKKFLTSTPAHQQILDEGDIALSGRIEVITLQR
jgi:ATP sulfurylase